MNKFMCAIYIIESIICFDFPVYLLVYAMVMAILYLGSLFQGESEGGGSAFLLLVALGLLGIYGVFQMLLKIVNPELEVERREVVLSCLLSGLVGLAVAMYLAWPLNVNTIVIFTLPILCTLHYMFLIRAFLFNIGKK